MATNRRVVVVASSCLAALVVVVSVWVLVARTGVRTRPATMVNSAARDARRSADEGTGQPASESGSGAEHRPVASRFSDQSELNVLHDLAVERNPRSWTNLSYVNINESETFRAFLNHFDLTQSDVQLSPAQRQNLVASLEAWCLAFRKGTFDDFQKFRVPTPHKIKDKATTWQKRFLLDDVNVKAEDIPEDPNAIWELYWEQRNRSEWGFAGLWQAIAVPQVSVRESSRFPTTLADQQDLLDRPAACFQGSVEFERGARHILREEGVLVYADVEVVVHHITGLTYPVVVRCFWDRRAEKWLPEEMIVCYTGRGRKADPDF